MASVEALRAALEHLVRKLREPNADLADIDASIARIALLGREVTSAIESDFTAAREPDLRTPRSVAPRYSGGERV